MILLVSNYLKYDGNGDKIQMISHNVDVQEKNECLCYNTQHVIYQRKNNFNNASIIAISNQSLRARSKNKSKHMREVQQENQLKIGEEEERKIIQKFLFVPWLAIKKCPELKILN